MNRKIKSALHTLGIVALVGLSVVVGRMYMLSRETTLQFILRVTGIALPAKSVPADTYDNGEMYSVAHVTIPLERIKDFTAQYKFVPISEEPRQFIEWRQHYDLWLEHLTEANRHLPDHSELYTHSARTVQNKWECVLDPNTGSLWMLVFYPDPGGDNP